MRFFFLTAAGDQLQTELQKDTLAPVKAEIVEINCDQPKVALSNINDICIKKKNEKDHLTIVTIPPNNKGKHLASLVDSLNGAVDSSSSSSSTSSTCTENSKLMTSSHMYTSNSSLTCTKCQCRIRTRDERHTAAGRVFDLLQKIGKLYFI